jgi:hypothetical protein
MAFGMKPSSMSRVPSFHTPNQVEAIPSLQVGIVALNIVGQPLDVVKLASAQQAFLGRGLQDGKAGRAAVPEDPMLETVDAVTAQQLREVRH